MAGTIITSPPDAVGSTPSVNPQVTAGVNVGGTVAYIPIGQRLSASSLSVVIASDYAISTSSTSNGNTGSAVPTQATFVGGKDGSGNLRGLLVSTAGVLSVDGSAVTQPVSGTVSISGTVPVSGTIAVSSVSGTVTVSGTVAVSSVSGTVAISATSLPLPTGASTAAKQPALGTAGTPSSDVITVQGITSMTALKVDGSAVTQPVSGTVTANAGTNLNTSALALESGGNLATIATRTPALGQTTMTGSTPVVIASDQSKVLTAGRTATGLPTAAADGDTTSILVDKSGRVGTMAYGSRELLTKVFITVSASTAETTLVAAGGSGVFLDLIQLFIINTSASPVRIDVRDSTGGTIRFATQVGATPGQSNLAFPSMLPQTTANNNWTVQSSASVTDLRILAIFVRSN